MNAEENSGLAESEQQTPATIDAGCEIEVDRSVSWTALSAGFAQLRTVLAGLREEAFRVARICDDKGFDNAAANFRGMVTAFDMTGQSITVIEANAKDACTRREEPDFNGPSS